MHIFIFKMSLTSKISHHCMSVLIEQNIVAAKITCSTHCGATYYFSPLVTLTSHQHQSTQQWRPPVEVPVDDGLGEIVQILHTLGHVNGDDELGLKVDQPVH